ncbi:conserved exported hypothetical protein [Sphingomonas sp. EC-HK361]|uniref:hypothetical protein n=1 Tax=Sphingomonas sp. EC-HK361 TaxID=2038397 RepID=UPI00125AF05A|nr:hypothetical protein [Sphingomonas sp. EC-HK361]VVT16575.1 conserved exported hypothetical protein [Sphingomonas sp. EC-HK361]
MVLKRLGLALGLGLAVAGCTDGYGYSGVSLGYGGGYYSGDPYYDGGYGGYGYGGYGYAPSYFGWYGDYYYPGSGVYVYDRYRRPYRWNNSQRSYWQGRRGNYRGNGSNWGGFDRDHDRGDGNWNRGNRGNWDRGDRGDWNRGNRGDGDRGSWRGNYGGQGRPQISGGQQPSATPQAATPRPTYNRGQRGGGDGRWSGRRSRGN